MENEGLDDILNGAAEAEPMPAVAEEVQAEAQAGQPRDEHGRFAPKGDTEAPEPQEAAPPAAMDDEGPPIPRKALLDERSKRQALEAQLQQMQAQLQAYQHPPQAPPSIFEDEQGWEQHFGQTVVQQAVQAATQNARLDMSEMMARQAHTDFEEKKAVFLEAMQNTPGLQQRALQDPHPWNFAYQYVVNQQRMQELSAVNVTELEAKLRAQIQAEYEAKAQGGPLANPAASLPPSLSGQRNVGSRQGPTWAGPSPLSDILNR